MHNPSGVNFSEYLLAFSGSSLISPWLLHRSPPHSYMTFSLNQDLVICFRADLVKFDGHIFL